MFWFSVCFLSSTISTYVCLRFHYLNLDLFFVLLISSFLAFHLNLKVFFKKIFFSICVNSIRSVFKFILHFIFLKLWWPFFFPQWSLFFFPSFSYLMWVVWIFFFRYSSYNSLWFFYFLIWIFWCSPQTIMTFEGWLFLLCVLSVILCPYFR